jgi:hypothetical protein
MQLKYLFQVEYTDGTTFKQNKEDVSSTDPKRSAFYDVLQSGKPIKRFSLVEDKLINPKKVTVDLTDGHFEMNGVPFISEADRPLPVLPEAFTIVFFRRHIHQFNTTTNAELSHTISYFLGWKCWIAKKEYQQVIGIT